jgi:hypothetical protein
LEAVQCPCHGGHGGCVVVPAEAEITHKAESTHGCEHNSR